MQNKSTLLNIIIITIIIIDGQDIVIISYFPIWTLAMKGSYSPAIDWVCVCLFGWGQCALIYVS